MIEHTPHAPSTNGTNSGHPTTQVEREVQIPRPSAFWQGGPVKGGHRWYSPAVAATPAATDGHSVESQLEELKQLLPEHPLRSWLLKWQWRTGAGAATVNHEAIRAEAQDKLAERNRRIAEERRRVEEEISRLCTIRDDVGGELIRARQELADAAAAASVTLSTAEADAKQFEAALIASAPTIEDLAGKYAVSAPPDERTDLLFRLATGLKDLVILIAFGAAIGVSQGVVTGLIELVDLEELERLPRFLAAATLGFAVIAIMGVLVEKAVEALGSALEPADPSVPGHRGALPIGIGHCVTGVAVVITEILLEALALQGLEIERLAVLKHQQPDTTLTPHSLGFWCVPASLWSLSYSGAKAAQAWVKQIRRLRLARLRYFQRKWLEARRAEPVVQNAAKHAELVGLLRDRLAGIVDQIRALETKREQLVPEGFDPDTKATLDAAYAAAVGEAAKLHSGIEPVVDTLEPLAPIVAR